MFYTRYSQFEDLDKKLRILFGENLPSLPKKTYLTFFVGKTQDDLEQRRLGLDEYIKVSHIIDLESYRAS